MEEIKISGRISHVLELKAGVGASSGKEWKKQTFVMEKQRGEYVDRVAFDVWGDKIDEWGLKVGDEVTLSLDINAREYNGRWYNDVRAYKCERVAPDASQQAQPAPAPVQQPQPRPVMPQPQPQAKAQAKSLFDTAVPNGQPYVAPANEEPKEDDLPF